METTYRSWEKRQQEQGRERRRASAKRFGAGMGLGGREKRRLAQLVACLVLFLLVFIGKGILPDQMLVARDKMLELIRADTDFKGAFYNLGRSISAGEPVLDTLNGLWVDVFGGGTVAVAGGLTADDSPGLQKQVAFLTGFPVRQEPASHWLGQEPAPILPEAPPPQAEAGPAPEPEPVPEPEQPAVEHIAYNGPQLPDNATMDKYNLSAVGLTETATPVLGWVSSGYGWREHPVDGGEKFHNGIDLAVNDGTDVQAFADGVVAYIGDDPNVYGKYLKINHAGGVATFYAHCKSLLVKQGQKVTVGQVVAQAGGTGNATGPHLHFEVWLNGIRLNPQYYISTN